MCGDVPDGHYKTDVVVVLNRGEGKVTVPLGISDDVTEIWITEYMVQNPNSATVAYSVSGAVSDFATTTFTTVGVCALSVGDEVLLGALTGVYAVLNGTWQRVAAATAASFTIETNLNLGAAVLNATASHVAGTINAGSYFRAQLFLNNSQHHLTNAAGQGHVLSLKKESVTHKIYSNPRTYSLKGAQRISQLQLSVTDMNGAKAQFQAMHIHLTFVCRIPEWNFRMVSYLKEIDPNVASVGHYASNAPWIPKTQPY